MISEKFIQILSFLFAFYSKKSRSNAIYAIKSTFKDPESNQQVVVIKPIDSIGAEFPIKAVDLVNNKKQLLKNFDVDDIVTITGLAYLGNAPKITEKTGFGQFKYLPMLCMVFFAGLLTANISSAKVVSFFGLIMPAGLFVYPLTYVCIDICTEVYGYKNSRMMIWSGFLASLIYMFFIQLAIHISPSPFWHNQSQFETVLSASTRVTIASLITFFFSEFTNSYALAKLKLAYPGQKIWVRVISSSFLGMLVDCILFKSIAYFNVIPTLEIPKLIIESYLFRIACEILFIPFTLSIINWTKRKEHIDIYDINTKFTPFSLETSYTQENNRRG
ncbi:queuosine precursor transporter [Piscirickettsia salmonis]|uniref:queuosine precursor transporter n=1 Tax=Piscirickettsia salmonis TaxID=1238 RepID=UPI003EB83E65